METIVIIGAGASGLACMNELLKENKLMEFTVNNGCNHHNCGHH